jgi:hypothetical protein
MSEEAITPEERRERLEALFQRGKQHLEDLLQFLPKGYRLSLIGYQPNDDGHEFFVSKDSFEDLHKLLNRIEQTAETLHGPKGLN